MTTYALPKTPVGDLSISTEKGAVTKVSWTNQGEHAHSEASSQLQEYFAKKRQLFDLKLAFTTGTPFQQQVWHKLCEIPYGKTVTYGDLAKQLNTSPRAIGGAVGSNPIPIIVPCHRVVGSNGKMTGFSGGKGIPTKEILLNLEQNH